MSFKCSLMRTKSKSCKNLSFNKIYLQNSTIKPEFESRKIGIFLKKWTLKMIFPRFRDSSTKLVLNHSPLNTDFA